MKANKYVIFFSKCILVFLPFILVIGYTFVFPMGYMDNEYPARAYTHDVIESSDTYDTLILGDSRAMADILPADMDNAVLLANGGATAIENYYYLKDYVAAHGAPKRCIIGFAPFHYTYIDNFWNRTVYFNDLSISELSEVRKEARRISKEDDFTEDSIVLTGGDTADIISNRLRLPHVYMPALVNSHFIGRYSDNKSGYSKISEECGHQLYGTEDGSSDLNYETSYLVMNESADSKLVQSYLIRLLDLCEQYGIDTYVISLPMNESSYSNLKEEYIQSLSMFLRSIADIYPSVTVEKDIVSYDDSLFGDSSHLNENGAIRFTEELKQKYGF